MTHGPNLLPLAVSSAEGYTSGLIVASDCTIAVSAEQAAYGAQSFKVVSASGSYWAIYYLVPVLPSVGTTITFQAEVFATTSGDTANTMVETNLANSWAPDSPTLTPLGTWTKVRQEYTVESGVSYIHLYVAGSGPPTTVYVDKLAYWVGSDDVWEPPPDTFATGRYRRRPIAPRRSGVNTAGLVASSGARHVIAAGKPTEPWYAYRSRVILAVEEPASSGDATVVAPVAIVDAASPAPTVTAIRNATVTPPAATVTVAAPTPTVGVGATVIAPVATVSVTALAPTTVSGGASATAPAATVTAAAPAPSVTAGVTVTTPAAGVATAASAPSITAGATVTAVTAALTVTAPAPTVAGSATVLAVAATVMVSAPVPSVGAGATVTTVTAAVTVSAPAPTVSAASSGGVVAPAAAVAVESLAPTVTAVRVAVVEAPTATITAGALAPTVVAIRAAIVAATAALVDVDALAPEVIGSGPTTAGILSGSNHPAADLAGASATSRLDGSQHGSDLGGATTTGGSMSGTSTTTTTISGG